MEHIKIHYGKDQNRAIGAGQWTHEIHVPQTIDDALAKGSREMIVVLPDSKTIYNGSLYSSSATTRDFASVVGACA